MEEITLQNVMPKVFAGQSDIASDVWCNELRLHKGEIYLVEADSGAGKSSLCSFLYGERCDYTGRILYDGVDIAAYTINRWVDVRSRHIAYLPQGMGIFPELTAMENILLKNRLTRHKSVGQIETMAAALGIDHKLDTPAANLSIGQQQRVALVRTLCQPCDFIMLDEPVSHLDEANNRVAAELVAAEARNCGAGIITTSVGNALLISGARRISL